MDISFAASMLNFLATLFIFAIGLVLLAAAVLFTDNGRSVPLNELYPDAASPARAA